jgi:hypothetical protein
MESYIDQCIAIGKDNHYDVANMIYNMLVQKDKSDFSYKRLSNFCSTYASHAVMERSLFWNAKALTDNNAADAYYDMSKTLAQIAMALKNNEYKKLVLTELQECFL